MNPVPISIVFLVNAWIGTGLWKVGRINLLVAFIKWQQQISASKSYLSVKLFNISKKRKGTGL